MSQAQIPPAPLDLQLVKAWIFTQNPDGTFSPASFGGGGGTSNVNLTGINGTAPSVTNSLWVQLSDGTQAIGTPTNPIHVSGASEGATGATAPTSATEIGIIDDNGNLQGASSSNPVPVTVTNSPSNTANAEYSTQTPTPLNGVASALQATSLGELKVIAPVTSDLMQLMQMVLLELRSIRLMLQVSVEESGAAIAADFDPYALVTQGEESNALEN